MGEKKGEGEKGERKKEKKREGGEFIRVKSSNSKRNFNLIIYLILRSKSFSRFSDFSLGVLNWNIWTTWLDGGGPPPSNGTL